MIKQATLKLIVSLERQIEKLQLELDTLRSEVEGQASTAPTVDAPMTVPVENVEPGKYQAYFEWRPGRRSVSWRGVVEREKGAGYCENVLKNTKPGPPTRKLKVTG